MDDDDFDCLVGFMPLFLVMVAIFVGIIMDGRAV